MQKKIKSKIKEFSIFKRFEDEEEKHKMLKKVACIGFGTLVGITTYSTCLYNHIDIWGWNFGLVLSPLFAGYAESLSAKYYLNESTGAISAFILFIITVIYGFIIANPTLGFNIITMGSIVIIVQAAMPTATNYFLIALGLDILSHISSFLRKTSDFLYETYKKLFKKEPKLKEIHDERNAAPKYNFYDMELEMNDLGILIMTLEYPPKELNITEQKGIYESRHIFSFKQREEIKSGLEGDLEEELLSTVKLAQDKALLKLIKQLKADGCNGLLNLNTSFETLGPSKGENVSQVVMKGTGIIYEKEDAI